MDGSKPCPSKFIETKHGQEVNEKYEEWQVIDQTLLRWLYSSLSLDVATHMINCKYSPELWKNVQDLVGAITKGKVMWYKNENQRTRKGSMKMRDYLIKMKEYANNLQLASCNYLINDLFTQILYGLDSKYTPIVVTLNEKENITLIEFQTYLLSFESRLDQLNSFQNLSLIIVSLLT